MATKFIPLPDSLDSLEYYGKIIDSPTEMDHVLPSGTIALGVSFTAVTNSQDIYYIPDSVADQNRATFLDMPQGKFTIQALVVGPNKGGRPLGSSGGEFVFDHKNVYKIRIADKVYTNSILTGLTIQSKEISATTHHKTLLITREVTVLGTCK